MIDVIWRSAFEGIASFDLSFQTVYVHISACTTTPMSFLSLLPTQVASSAGIYGDIPAYFRTDTIDHKICPGQLSKITMLLVPNQVEVRRSSY